MEKRRRLLLALLAIFLVVLVVLGLSPLKRDDWVLENVLVFIAVPVLVFTARRFPFSRASYLAFFVFFCAHEIGAHYSYSAVPYREWLGLEPIGRNHYDRWIHFLYGLLMIHPARELLVRLARLRGFWSYFLPLTLLLAGSLTYELIEWAAALVFGGDLGQAYVGTQGDEWDAHKDMALAGLGALLALGAELAGAKRHRGG